MEDGRIALPHVLICESLDRLNRQAPLDALSPFIGLIRAGITLVTLTDRQWFTRESMAEDGGLRLLGSLLVMLRAHEESATKSKRVRAAWERKRRDAAHRKLTKTCPAWLRLSADRSEFEVLQSRADIVRRVYEETADGLGKGSIAARLNAADVPAFRGKQGWHASYVQKLLSSDAPLGIYQPHTLQTGRRVPTGEPVRGYFPAILDERLVMRARAALVARRQGSAGRKGADFRNILTGVARCSACGGSMTYVGKGDAERYLACSTARRRRGCESRGLFNFNEAERRFLEVALRFDPAARASPAIESMRGNLQHVQREVARLSRRLARLLASFDGDATDEIVAAVAGARDKLAETRREESRLSEALLVEEHGAGLTTLREAIEELRGASELPPSELFRVRAQIAYAAKTAGFAATFHWSGRRVEVRCVGFPEPIWFDCAPKRGATQRDPLGRFAKQVSQR